MPVTIRMRKVGKGANKVFYFRIGVLDQRKARDAKIIEDIGSYDPCKKVNNFKIDLERYDYWKSKGAIISQTIQSLVKSTRKSA